MPEGEKENHEKGAELNGNMTLELGLKDTEIPSDTPRAYTDKNEVTVGVLVQI